MRYAMYIYTGDPHYNLGDSMQLVALENIYRILGVCLDEVIKINWHDLATYAGEPVVLPIVSGIESSFGARSELTQFSSNITPLYLSYVRFNPMSSDDAQYLHNYQPIGCRDEYTYNECLKYGINAYINGCITASLPARENLPENGKVFLVDPEPELLPHIPKDIMKNAVMLSHIIRNEDEFDALKYARDLYETYKKEARLIVTKRLHCALPCIAAGIPVVFAKTTLTKTLMFVDSLTTIYNTNRTDKIVWDNPVQTIHEDIKEHIIQIALYRLRNPYTTAFSSDIKSIMTQLHNSYQKDRNSKEYLINIQFKHIQKALPSKLETFNYCFYGVGNEILTHYLYMKYRYPNATLKHIYDKYSYGQIIYGMKVKSIATITQNLNDFCVITAVTPKTRDDMSNCLKQFGKEEGTYV